MSPLRLVVLAILIYIAFLLFRSRRRKKKPPSQTPETPPGPPAHDMLAEDPVCGVLVPEGQALSVRYRGKTVFFCSEECRRQFIEKRDI